MTGMPISTANAFNDWLGKREGLLYVSCGDGSVVLRVKNNRSKYIDRNQCAIEGD